MNYFWIRIYDYQKDAELKEHTDPAEWESTKGTLLDEYYLSGESLSRDEAKAEVTKRSNVEKFAKPRKKGGVYAIVMESSEYYYDRFTREVDTICFCCHSPVKGKAIDFPKMAFEDEMYYFCSYECRRKTNQMLSSSEGEFQEREDYRTNGGVYGYIYHIY